MKTFVKISILFLVLCTFSDSVSSSLTFWVSVNANKDSDEELQEEEKEEKTEKEKGEEERGEEENFKTKASLEIEDINFSTHFYKLGKIHEPHQTVLIPIAPSYSKDTPPPEING